MEASGGCILGLASILLSKVGSRDCHPDAKDVLGNPGLERPKGSAAEPARPGKLRGFPAAAAASRRCPRPPNGAGPPPNRGNCADNADSVVEKQIHNVIVGLKYKF